MGARREAKEAAAAATEAEKASARQYVDAALREYKPRKGGTAKFKKGSKVLVPHTDQYYAAVVLQGQKRPDGQYYLLHYEGWSNKYNEWVEEAGVVRYDRSLLEQSAAAAGNAPGDLTGRKRKADIAPAEPALAVEIPQQLRLHIPPLLKKVVLDDSEQINLKGMLLPLPRNAHGRPTVNDILKEYEEALAKEAAKEAAKEGGEKQDPLVAEAAREMVAGVRQYFDRSLRHFLLYSHEVQQADAALGAGGAAAAGAGGAGAAAAAAAPGAGSGGGGADAGAGAGGASKSEKGAAAGSSAAEGPSGSGSGSSSGAPAPSDLYGAEHLVRLLVKLPELVPVAYMTPPDVVRLEQQLHDLMARMTGVKKQARYFSLAEEYRKNPHFNHIMALHYQSLLGAGGAGTAGGGTPGPAMAAGAGGSGTPAPASRAAPGGTGGGAAAGAAGAAAGMASRGGTDTGANSEAADMDQE